MNRIHLKSLRNVVVKITCEGVHKNYFFLGSFSGSPDRIRAGTRMRIEHNIGVRRGCVLHMYTARGAGGAQAHCRGPLTRLRRAQYCTQQ